MKIKDIINNRCRNLEVIGTVINVEPFTLSSKRLVKATIADDTGSIILNLWGNQVDQCKVGDFLKSRKHMLNYAQGVPELNT